MILKSTQLLTDMNTRDISLGVQATDKLTAFRYRMSRYPSSLNLLVPHEPAQECNGIVLPL
jgi:hypothetical protein